MKERVKGIRFRNLDGARKVIQQFAPDLDWDIFDDDGSEPEGLLSVVTEDRIGEEFFYRLLDARKGTLLEVVKKSYSGFGPPAQEDEYMGFVSEGICYVLAGCDLPIEIEGCPEGAIDVHHLEALVLDRQHGLDREDLASRLELPANWDFDDLFDLISSGAITATQIDRLIHRGIH